MDTLSLILPTWSTISDIVTSPTSGNPKLALAEAGSSHEAGTEAGTFDQTGGEGIGDTREDQDVGSGEKPTQPSGGAGPSAAKASGDLESTTVAHEPSRM